MQMNATYATELTQQTQIEVQEIQIDVKGPKFHIHYVFKKV